MQVIDGQCVAWMSNPLFLLAWLGYLLKADRMAAALLVAACLIGLDTFRATRFDRNEAGHQVMIDHVGVAFYVWESSFVVLLVLVLMRIFTTSAARSG